MNKHEHTKPQGCAHDMTHCEQCDVAYCKKCEREWRNYINNQPLTNLPYTPGTPYMHFSNGPTGDKGIVLCQVSSPHAHG